MSLPKLTEVFLLESGWSDKIWSTGIPLSRFKSVEPVIAKKFREYHKKLLVDRGFEGEELANQEMEDFTNLRFVKIPDEVSKKNIWAARAIDPQHDVKGEPAFFWLPDEERWIEEEEAYESQDDKVMRDLNRQLGRQGYD